MHEKLQQLSTPGRLWLGGNYNTASAWTRPLAATSPHNLLFLFALPDEHFLSPLTFLDLNL